MSRKVSPSRPFVTSKPGFGHSEITSFLFSFAVLYGPQYKKIPFELQHKFFLYLKLNLTMFFFRYQIWHFDFTPNSIHVMIWKFRSEFPKSPVSGSTSKFRILSLSLWITRCSRNQVQF